MNRNRVMSTAVAGLLGMFLAAFPAAGEVPWRESGADQIELADGSRLTGTVLGTTPTSVIMAVEWSWIDRHDPARGRAWREAWRRQEKGRRETLIERLDKWLAERPESIDLVSFLESEKRRLKTSPVDPDAWPFALRSIPRRDVRRLRRAPPDRRRIYLAAWIAGKRDVTNRTVTELRRELLPAALQDELGLADLLPLLPPQPDTLEAWAVRRALLEHAYGQPLEFQAATGIGLVTGLPKMDLGAGDLNRMLGQLMGRLNDNAARKSTLDQAIEAARSRHARGFVLKELETEGLGLPKAVRLRFVVRMPGGRWRSVFDLRKKIPRGEPGRADELARDPQVRRVLEMARGFGLQIEDGLLKQALQAGAGVEKALKAASAQFLHIQQTYANSVDRPLILWGSATGKNGR